MHSYHAATGVIYYAQINKNAVSCWNSNKELKAANFKEVVRDNDKLIYPSDLSVSLCQLFEKIYSWIWKNQIKYVARNKEWLSIFFGTITHIIMCFGPKKDKFPNMEPKH